MTQHMYSSTHPLQCCQMSTPQQAHLSWVLCSCKALAEVPWLHQSTAWNAWQSWDPAQHTQTYPNAEQGTDRFVVTGLELHVTAVPELVDIPSPPKDPVTPRWHTTLPTTRKSRLPGKSSNPSRPSKLFLFPTRQFPPPTSSQH